ncbi:MAG TPA: hypothetical protein VIT85_05090 [Solirubrobacterales bacterium]
MRPVNLLPAEERRGGHAPMRTGALPYVVLGSLVLLLVGVVALVLTGNQVSEREDEVATLKVENTKESARAERLAAYTQFHNLQEQRVATVRSLADSRFDWERVMRELSLVLPANVWLVDLVATASPEASTGAGSGDSSGLRSGSPGPALEIEGCAVRQAAVAGFVTALKDIDGVTRVGVKLSELAGGDETASVGEAGGDEGSDTECRTEKYIAKFELVVAFDAAPVISTEEGSATTTEVAATEETTGSEEGAEEPAESEGG